MGITPPAIQDTQLVLQPGGVLVAHLPASFGANKILLLHGPVDPAVIGAEWRCETNVESRPDTCKGY